MARNSIRYILRRKVKKTQKNGVLDDPKGLAKDISNIGYWCNGVYQIQIENPQIIVCVFTISNDSIKTSFLLNSRKKKVIKDIPRQKQMKSYPEVLIGRLGVNKNFRSVVGETDRTGKQLMDFIKSWFIDGVLSSSQFLSKKIFPNPSRSF